MPRRKNPERLPPVVVRLSSDLQEPEYRPQQTHFPVPESTALPGVKKILIGSGVRYDIAVKSPEYIRELVTHHVGGLLKIAPEHTEQNVLSKMMKPGIGTYDEFKRLFDRYSKEAGKEQYLVPYFIAAHPGATDEDMLNLALWLKRNRFRPDQVADFHADATGAGNDNVSLRTKPAGTGFLRF